MITPLNANDQYKDFMLAFINNDLIKVQYYLTNKIFKMDSIFANESVFGFAILHSKFELVKWVFDFSNLNINKIPKGIYAFESWISKAGKNADNRILDWLASLNIDGITDKDYEAALINSIGKNSDSVVRSILKLNKCNPSIGLQTAIACNPQYVELLLSAGADLTAKYNNMNSIVFALSRELPHPLLYAKLANNANILYYSIYNNDLESINKYITNQVAASFTAELLFNPLLIAVRYSNLETIKLVYSYISDPNIKTSAHAVINGRFGGGMNIINMVVKRTFDENLYNYVFSLGADINNIGDDFTALQNAVKDGDMIKVKYLLDKGCDPNIITLNGTAGHVCVYSKNYNNADLSMMTLLLNYNLNLNLGYPNTQEPYYRGVNTIDLAARINKPNPSLIVVNKNKK